MARQQSSVTIRVAVGSAVAVALLAIAVAIAAAAVTVTFARTVITPPKRRQEDLLVLALTEDTITLSPALDSMTPGRYSLWFTGDSGHARVGEILSYTASNVTRQLLGVDFGDIGSARHGRFSGWYFLDPRDLGLPVEDVEVQTELGPAPAWLVRAAEPSGRWMIGVHGRAVRRAETIRSVPVFHEAGYTSLLVTYRNDGDAPRTKDHRYALGDTEWVDVESAMRFAIDHGATEIVLMGWSMGGAMVLQVVTRSPLAAAVRGVILESPVVDWVTALDFHGVANRLPKPLRLGVLQLLGSRWARFVTGQAAPVDLARLDLVTRSGELDVPILLLHSDDDGFVPPDASIALARARPDIATFERFVTARHTKLWNYDEARWNTAIASWLARLSPASVRTGNRPRS
jgi:alpha-beta hydrolase superfamily lysophospholipase